ncbi:MAG: HEPN domain-containing protein [Treponema sp.]|jgi:HEPN domain-containing protein|nr:HEPN domain-containing protein [Treponema sp.]
MIDNRIIQEWLRYSQSDMIAARYMFYNVNPKQTEISVFHCQQCAEKALKAYLVAHEIDPPKIHDLPILCKMCAEIDEDFLSLMNISSDLNPYAVAARYPKQLVSDEKEVEVAIGKAQQIYDFCIAKVDFLTSMESGEECEDDELEEE